MITQRGGSRAVYIGTYDALKDLTMPNTKVVAFRDNIHLMVHSGITEGSPSEINFIATLLCVNGTLNQEIIFAPDQHLGRYIEKITGRKMPLMKL
jgi:hypothetical protein